VLELKLLWPKSRWAVAENAGTGPTYSYSLLIGFFI